MFNFYYHENIVLQKMNMIANFLQPQEERLSTSDGIGECCSLFWALDLNNQNLVCRYFFKKFLGKFPSIWIIKLILYHFVCTRINHLLQFLLLLVVFWATENKASFCSYFVSKFPNSMLFGRKKCPEISL